ncbi:MAG: hypothetical protein QG585_439, partial [Patescibacteria group bacterium]|nr:hypothetical protein [Patescibacteria group bacterium]
MCHKKCVDTQLAYLLLIAEEILAMCVQSFLEKYARKQKSLCLVG